MSVMSDNGFGYIEWRNDKGELHREDGPAIEWPNGSKFWYENGKYIRKEEVNDAKFSWSGVVSSNKGLLG